MAGTVDPDDIVRLGTQDRSEEFLFIQQFILGVLQIFVVLFSFFEGGLQHEDDDADDGGDQRDQFSRIDGGHFTIRFVHQRRIVLVDLAHERIVLLFIRKQGPQIESFVDSYHPGVRLSKLLADGGHGFQVRLRRGQKQLYLEYLLRNGGRRGTCLLLQLGLILLKKHNKVGKGIPDRGESTVFGAV